VIEATIESIRVSMVTQHRVVILKQVDAERYLPIWIGSHEADAIALELQQVTVARPLTHDLLKTVISELGAIVTSIVVSDLKDDTFYARVVMDQEGRLAEVDSRPSDAIALAVRVKVPIYVEEAVMDKAGVSLDGDMGTDEEGDDSLSAFREFVNGLDLDDLGQQKGED
jgi:uncharacterized protein